jgi:hypothetical protein
VNGLEDILAWKGGKYADFLLPVAGGMASFGYLKFKRAKPPCMVYWGTSPKHFLRNLEKIIGLKQLITEGRTFKTTFAKLKESINNGDPVMAGALDMYYLHYYPEIYQHDHIPIHYVLVVGYDDEKRIVYVHDCSRTDTQELPYTEFEKSLDVKVPGMSNKNTLRIFRLPRIIPSELDLAKKGLALKAEQMLRPPVSMFGIPAMRKLAEEITSWKDKGCFEHLVTYATTPPVLPKSYERSDGMRFVQESVLRTLGEKYNVNRWVEASTLFRESGNLITNLCKAYMEQDTSTCSDLVAQIADIEEEAYGLLS